MTDRLTPVTPVDALLRERVHGAVNIRGVRYQILYSVARAVALLAPGAETGAAVRLEGIEDLDAVGAAGPRTSAPATLVVTGAAAGHDPLDAAGRPAALGAPAAPGERPVQELVQVKTADAPWNWAKLGEPLKNFLAAIRAYGEPVPLRLVIDFVPRGDLATLARYASLPGAQRQEIAAKFRALARKQGAADAEADALLAALAIESLDEPALMARLRPAVARAFDLVAPSLVDAYVLVLVGRCLEWARQRRTVTRDDVAAVGRTLQEGAARQAHFDGVVRGLVVPLAYAPDASPDDFFDGRRARVGHVAADLDVRRPAWQARIDAALLRVGVCVLRAPSGQGKSTLAYRYARDHWPAGDTFELLAAETPEQVAAVANFLSFRAELGLPSRLLIDADWRVPRWPDVAAACARLGVAVLVTARVEDWVRFPLHALTRREVLEPDLARDEARHVYDELTARGRAHPAVDSADWAYERIGEPRLLLEFVYLVTHGQMLAERLRDQVGAFRAAGEDAATKIAVLRRVALADALGAAVPLHRVLEGLAPRDDPQHLLASLAGEYIAVEGRAVRGLHWVRSEHLARQLHEGHPDVTGSVLETSALLPAAGLTAVIENALDFPEVDEGRLLAGLAGRYAGVGTADLLAVVEGLFRAGERRYFAANRDLFDEAFELAGPGGLLLIQPALGPFPRPDILASIAETLAGTSDRPRRLQEIAARARPVPRGFDLVRTFLREAAPMLAPERMTTGTEAGRLLDWCALTEVALPAWPAARDRVIADATFVARPPDEVAAMAQGLWRYEPDAYRAWFARHEADVTAYLRLHTDSLTMTHDSERAEATFIVEPEDVGAPNDEAVRRIDLLRAVLPFASTYATRGVYVLPFGLVPSVDDSRKNMPVENAHLETDVAKNVVWRDLVGRTYYPDGYYRLQQAWNEARRGALRVAEGLTRYLRRVLNGDSSPVAASIPDHAVLLPAVERALVRLPSLTAREMRAAGLPLLGQWRAYADAPGPRDWSGAVGNFLRSGLRFITHADRDAGRLAVHNLRDLVQAVPGMHAAFAAMFADVPDYCGQEALAVAEGPAYAALELFFGAAVEAVAGRAPGAAGGRVTLDTLREERRRRTAAAIARVGRAVSGRLPAGLAPLLASDLAHDGVLRVLGLGIPVGDVSAPLYHTLARVAEALYEVRDVAEVFWIVPLHPDGAYAAEDGLSVSSYTLECLADGAADAVAWESLVPRPLPHDVRALLPPRPVRPVPELAAAARLWAAAAAADVYARRRALVEELETGAAHALDREFAARHRARLVPVRDAARHALADAQDTVAGGHVGSTAAPLLADAASVVADAMALDEWIARWPPDAVEQVARAASGSN